MIAYIIIIVVVAVLLLGVGSTMFLRPRGMHGVRRSRNGALDMTGSMPAVKDAATDTEGGGGTATAPPPPAPGATPGRNAPPSRRRHRAPPWRSRRPRRAGWYGCGRGWLGRRAASVP